MQFEALGGDEATIRSVVRRFNRILASDEAITCIVVQHALARRKPDAIVLTTRRYVAFRRGLRKAVFDEGLWADLQDVRLDEGPSSSTLTLRFVSGEEVVVDRLCVDHARRACALAQEKEKEAIQTRRRMEEFRVRARAALGALGAVPPVQPPPSDGTVVKLIRLKEQLDAHWITEEEYNQKKGQVLSQM